ncbi:hypothetical protein MTR_1g076340 [Medicago truncatula]|uniref:Transmembrane protein n=1 Tax=Medicago truncatula TaxID=3880 RepID=A0A072VMY7_MEDTR|nr:hypothetical protein MTR_1g076340 [Medicago truncatula]
MVLKMALLFIVIVGVMVGNTRGIETAQGIKDEMKYPYSTPIDFEHQSHDHQIHSYNFKV